MSCAAQDSFSTQVNRNQNRSFSLVLSYLIASGQPIFARPLKASRPVSRYAGASAASFLNSESFNSYKASKMDETLGTD